VSLLVDLYGLYNLLQNRGNYLTFNIFILLETLSLYIYFYQILFQKYIKRIIIGLLVFFIAYWSLKFIKSGQTLALYSCLKVENISILILAIYFYYEQIIKINSVFIYREPRFWVVSAYLIYLAGTFFLLLYLPFFSPQDRLKFYGVLNSIFIIIRTILLSIAMFMKTNHPIRQKFKLT